VVVDGIGAVGVQDRLDEHGAVGQPGLQQVGREHAQSVGDDGAGVHVEVEQRAVGQVQPQRRRG
jgi:hypothetical protein